MKRTKITDELISDIRKLRKEGMIYGKIAETLGIGKTTASKYGREVIVVKKAKVDTIKPKIPKPTSEDLKPKKLSKREMKKLLKAKDKEAKKLKKELKKARNSR